MQNNVLKFPERHRHRGPVIPGQIDLGQDFLAIANYFEQAAEYTSDSHWTRCLAAEVWRLVRDMRE